MFVCTTLYMYNGRHDTLVNYMWAPRDIYIAKMYLPLDVIREITHLFAKKKIN